MESRAYEYSNHGRSCNPILEDTDDLILNFSEDLDSSFIKQQRREFENLVEKQLDHLQQQVNSRTLKQERFTTLKPNRPGFCSDNGDSDADGRNDKSPRTPCRDAPSAVGTPSSWSMSRKNTSRNASASRSCRSRKCGSPLPTASTAHDKDTMSSSPRLGGASRRRLELPENLLSKPTSEPRYCARGLEEHSDCEPAGCKMFGPDKRKACPYRQNTSSRTHVEFNGSDPCGRPIRPRRSNWWPILLIFLVLLLLLLGVFIYYYLICRGTGHSDCSPQGTVRYVPY